MGFMVAQSRGSFIGGAGAGRGCACARAHGLRDDFELVGSRVVVLLLVLDAAVVLEEEFAGLLEHPAAFADGTGGGSQNMKTLVKLHFHSSQKLYVNWNSTRGVILLSFSVPVEEVGPLRARLFAADPEHCRYPNNQRHQVFHQKQGEVRAVVLSCLK